MIELRSECGKVAVVDNEDRHLAAYSWHVTGKGYFATMIAGKKTRLHKLVAGAGADHIDRNKLNNRRGNLRAATVTQNNQNRGRLSSNTTGYKGVSKDRLRFAAVIEANGKRKYLGSFRSALAAAEAYDRAALALHGEFAVTNASLGLHTIRVPFIESGLQIIDSKAVEGCGQGRNRSLGGDVESVTY